MSTITLGRLPLGDGTTKICFPITGVNLEQLKEEALLMKDAPCDLVEWRVDFFCHAGEPQEVLHALAELRHTIGEKPILFTFRTQADGGERAIEQSDYIHLNQLVLESGLADGIDIELDMAAQGDPDRKLPFNSQLLPVTDLVNFSKICGKAVFISKHIFEEMPDNDTMLHLFSEMRKLGADVAKLAVMAQNPQEVERALNCMDNLRQQGSGPFILIAMGENGKITRRPTPYRGSELTYARGLHSTAPGQLTLEELCEG